MRWLFHRILLPLHVTCLLAIILACPHPARGYVEAVYPLGRILQESTNIMLLKLQSVDETQNVLTYQKIRDIKGQCPMETIRHTIGQRGFNPREWQNVMQWAKPGRTAVFFYAGGAGETCIDNYWYQTYGSQSDWTLSHAEPFLLRSFAGRPDKCADAVTSILAGQEITVPCMIDGDKLALHLRNARIQRLRASLKIFDHNPTRDFVGWGQEDLRPLLGMPGFTQIGTLGRFDPGAGAIAVAAASDDKTPFLCLAGESRVAVLQMAGGAISEIRLPYTGGARTIAWADANADGKPDLLLITPSGPRLFTNLGTTFRDDSAALPKEPFYDLTAGTWIDYEGKPAILLANGFLGLRLYKNQGPATSGGPPVFADISDQVGLGYSGLAAQDRGLHLSLIDVDVNGRQGFLVSGEKGATLIRNTPKGFQQVANSGLDFSAAAAPPIFADFDSSKRPGLFVPLPKGSKIYRNLGSGRFQDITASSGDLARLSANIHSALWLPTSNPGRPDLVLGAFNGPNRYLRNLGHGAFVDATADLGLNQQIFNTRALAACDLNQDGTPDLILLNEGQESVVLIARPQSTTGNPKP